MAGTRGRPWVRCTYRKSLAILLSRFNIPSKAPRFPLHLRSVDERHMTGPVISSSAHLALLVP